MKRQTGFTLIELLVVLIVTAVLVALVWPAMNSGHRHAHSMQDATQVRGIHSGLVIMAQSNNNFFPGREKNGALSAQADVHWRIQTMIANNMFVWEYAQSPNEAVPDAGYSYDMVGLSDTLGLRFDGWRDTTNSEAPMVSDRLKAGTPGRPETYQSIHTNRPGDWRGNVAYNDNHVEFESTPLLKTNDGKKDHEKDDLFSAAGADDALMVYEGT